MNCKYYLTIGKIKKEVRVDEFKNWEDVEYSISRSGFTGIVRTFSSSFEFVGTAAQRITDAFMEYGLYAEGAIEVQTKQNDFTYVPVFACPLYFASYRLENGVVKINALDNSLAAIIKANKGRKYDFKMSEFTDSDEAPFKYDSVELDNMVSYKLGAKANSSNIVEFSTMDQSEYQKLPMYNTGEEIVGNKQMEWSTEQTAEAFEVKTNEEIAELHGVLPSDHGFPYGAYTKPLNRIINNRHGEGQTHEKVMVTVNAEFDMELPSGCTTDDLEIWVTTTNIYGSVVNFANSSEYVSYKQFHVENGTTKYYLENVKLPMYANFNLCVMARVRKKTAIQIRVLSSYFQVTWTGRYKPTTMSYVTPQSLLQKIMERMVDNRRKFTCSIDVPEEKVDISLYSLLGSWDTDTRIKDTILIPKDVVTNNPESCTFIHTTFTNFCKWMEAVFGYVYVIDGDNLTFYHRTKIFQDTSSVKTFKNVADVSYQVISDAEFSSVEAGYDLKDEAFNMRYEFNRKMVYDTGVVNTEKKLTLVSPYRADSVGFEMAYEAGINTDSEDKSSDEGIWFIYVRDTTDEGRPVKKITDGVSSVTGNVKQGMFNYVYSPIFNLKANCYFIASFVNRLKLTTLDVNEIKFYVDVGQVSTNRDFLASKDTAKFFEMQQFSLGELSFATDDQQIPEDLSAPVELTWMGRKYTGYVESVDARFEKEQSCEYKLIVKKVQNL